MVKHDQDLIQEGKDEKRGPIEQFRVLQGNLGRQERLRNRAAIVHAIEAQATGKAADKIDAIPDNLRGKM
jgi:hypothetical protein